jgi:hypothetical protein
MEKDVRERSFAGRRWVTRSAGDYERTQKRGLDGNRGDWGFPSISGVFSVFKRVNEAMILGFRGARSSVG